MYGKSNMETYITMCKIDSQWAFALWLRKLKYRLCISLEGWGGEEDGYEVQKREDICIPMADSRKISISALLTIPKPLTVWIRINCGKF